LPPVTKMLEGRDNTLGIVKKVAEDDHQAPPLYPLRHLMQNICRSRFLPGGDLIQLKKQLLQSRPRRLRRKRRSDTFVVDGEPNSVPLLCHQIRKRGGNVGGVLVLLQTAL